MWVAIEVVGQPDGLVPAVGCLCAKKRRGRSRLLSTPCSLVGRQPTHFGGQKKSEVFHFSADQE